MKKSKGLTVSWPFYDSQSSACTKSQTNIYTIIYKYIKEPFTTHHHITTSSKCLTMVSNRASKNPIRIFGILSSQPLIPLTSSFLETKSHLSHSLPSRFHGPSLHPAPPCPPFPPFPGGQDGYPRMGSIGKQPNSHSCIDPSLGLLAFPPKVLST